MFIGNSLTFPGVPKARCTPGTLAEFEPDTIRVCTQADLNTARGRGRKGGRPKALTPRKQEQALTLYSDENRSIAEICRTLNISRVTLCRYTKAK